jgi:hypothetical protein
MSMKNAERSAYIGIHVRPAVRCALEDLVERLTLPEDHSKQMTKSRYLSDLLERHLRRIGAISE